MKEPCSRKAKLVKDLGNLHSVICVNYGVYIINRGGVYGGMLFSFPCFCGYARVPPWLNI